MLIIRATVCDLFDSACLFARHKPLALGMLLGPGINAAGQIVN